MPAELVEPLNEGTNTLTIGSRGRNEWLNVGFGTILYFEIPAEGRVVIFGSDGILYDSLTDSGGAFVPAGSLIEVAGYSGDSFKITASDAG